MTFCQSRSHFLRHVKGRLHVGQVFCGRFVFLWGMEAELVELFFMRASKRFSQANSLSTRRERCSLAE